MTPGRNLHAFWDDIVGTDTSDTSVNSLAAGIAAEYVEQHGEHPRLARDPGDMGQPKASKRHAKSEVYTFGLETGSRRYQVALPAAINARRVARVQIAVSGFRLADAVNRKFK